MKLVASLIATESERERYLIECTNSLLEFCDEVRFLLEGERPWEFRLHGLGSKNFASRFDDAGRFFEHEGRARQRLLEYTLEAEPTHVLAIDCDEFVTDGVAVRRALYGTPAPVWSLRMEECWELCDDRICVREDGGWTSHEVGVIWKVDERIRYSIRDRALACGRVPEQVEQLYALPIDAQILHLGWANRAERAARYERYATHDGGKFHASEHLASIMWPDERVQCRSRDWPTSLLGAKDALLARANRT